MYVYREHHSLADLPAYTHAMFMIHLVVQLLDQTDNVHGLTFLTPDYRCLEPNTLQSAELGTKLVTR